jgi:hypothetical protein
MFLILQSNLVTKYFYQKILLSCGRYTWKAILIEIKTIDSVQSAQDAIRKYYTMGDLDSRHFFSQSGD